MKIVTGVLPTDIMQRFPTCPSPAGYSFANWISNSSDLEQVLGVAGFLSPEFVEIDGLVFWSRGVGEHLAEQDRLSTPFGDDARTIERYWNIFNIDECFVFNKNIGLYGDELFEAFGLVIKHFWSLALKKHYPGRTYRFELVSDLYDEQGLCLTFWRE